MHTNIVLWKLFSLVESPCVTINGNHVNDFMYKMSGSSRMYNNSKQKVSRRHGPSKPSIAIHHLQIPGFSVRHKVTISSYFEA